MAGRLWSRDELLVTFNLYCKLPFGKLHKGNPRIIDLADHLGRTPSAVAMKLTNLASLDPEITGTGRKGLRGSSKGDRAIFDEFYADTEALADASEEAWDRIVTGDQPTPMREQPAGASEVEQTIRARRVQRFFRDSLLINYERRCAVSQIAVPELLNASHIIPWAKDTQRRADPRNGILLCSVYDRAFDRGLMTFDDRLRVVLHHRLKDDKHPPMIARMFHTIEGQTMHAPQRAKPDPDALAYHREEIFAKAG